MIDCLVTGAGGALGSVVMRRLAKAHQHVYGFVSPNGPAPDFGQILRVDLSDFKTYRDRVLALRPRAIIHLAAVSKPSAAFDDPERAIAVNVGSTEALLELSDAVGARFVYTSTDMVFDGESAPYRETDATEPGTLYGRTKLEGECHVLAHPGSLVVRLPLLYGVPALTREPTFFENMLRALQNGEPVRLFEDEIRSPLWLEDAARACIQLAASELRGVIHVAGPEGLSRLEMGQRIAAALSCSDAALVATRRADHASQEPRPHDLRLDCSRYIAHFGTEPGRDMRTALARLLAGEPDNLPS